MERKVASFVSNCPSSFWVGNREADNRGSSSIAASEIIKVCLKLALTVELTVLCSPIG